MGSLLWIAVPVGLRLLKLIQADVRLGRVLRTSHRDQSVDAFPLRRFLRTFIHNLGIASGDSSSQERGPSGSKECDNGSHDLTHKLPVRHGQNGNEQCCRQLMLFKSGQ
jgi:hypothetical protein